MIMMAVVATVVLGAGSAARVWRWQDVWSAVGALIGIVAFASYQLLDPIIPPLVLPVASLFVGAGIALTYGTLFLATPPALPALEPPSQEEAAERLLALEEVLDRVRPTPQDWLLSAVLAIPCAALVLVGASGVFDAVPVVVGILSLAGPVGATLRLLDRRERTRAIEAAMSPYLTRALPSEGAIQAAGESSADAPSVDEAPAFVEDTSGEASGPSPDVE